MSLTNTWTGVRPVSSPGATDGGTSCTVTVGTNATAGRLLVATLSINKSATALSPGSGWTLINSYEGTSVAGALAWRIATGTTADNITWTWTTSRGAHACVMEFNDFTTPCVIDSATAPSPVDNATYSSLAIDMGTAARAGLALVFGSQDSNETWIAGSVTNSFTMIREFYHPTYDTSDDNGGVGEYVATKTVAASGSTSTTLTFGDWADQSFLLAALFAEAPSGTAAVTLGAATSSASGTETISGTAAPTLGAATSTASGTNTPPSASGTAAVTLAAATSAASGAQTMSGTAAPTLAAATGAATGLQTITGTAAPTLGAATSSAAGAETFTGTAAPTLADATSSATGLEAMTGTAAATLAAATASAEGTVSAAGATGSVAATLGDATASAAGVQTISGSAAPTLGAATSTAAGHMAPSGTAAITLGAATSSAAGAETFAGSAAVSLSAATAAASGAETFTGTAAPVLGAASASADGEVGEVTNPTGTAAITLGDATSTASGTALITGTAVGVLGQATAAAVGESNGPFTATAAPVLAAATSTADGIVLNPITGTVAAVLDHATASATGRLPEHTFVLTAVAERRRLQAGRDQGLRERDAQGRSNAAPYALIKEAGVYTQVPGGIDPARIAAAQAFYVGGREYPIDYTEMLALTAAGYGSMVTTS